MNSAIDVVLAVILVMGFAAGYKKGFLKQAIELVGFLASFIIALALAGAVASYLSSAASIPYEPSLVLGFVAVLIGAMVAFRFLATIIQKIIRMTLLGWIDRMTGALLGLVMGMVAASLIITILLAVPIPSGLRRGLRESNMSNFLQPVAPRIFDLVVDHGSGRINFDRIFRRDRSA
jgi:membrane protein required for colicin V production